VALPSYGVSSLCICHNFVSVSRPARLTDRQLRCPHGRSRTCTSRTCSIEKESRLDMCQEEHRERERRRVCCDCVMTDVSAGDSGNYTCEVRGRKSAVLSSVTHFVFVRGTPHHAHVFRRNILHLDTHYTASPRVLARAFFLYGVSPPIAPCSCSAAEKRRTCRFHCVSHLQNTRVELKFHEISFLVASS